MTIVITDADDPLRMTQEEHARWADQYSRTFMYYCGSPPPFESWVKNKMAQLSSLSGGDSQ